MSSFILSLFILGSTPLFAMCGGDAARAFENSLAISLDPKINARSFTTAADGGEELLEVVIQPNGIAKLKRNGVPIDPGPNDTMRYWVTDANKVRLERYVTGDVKGQKAVNSFFSNTGKGQVSAGEATTLGNKFKAMSAADQANLVGGIENKLRKGKEITEAEFLIAVKGQTGWRTLDGLLSSHLPDLQAAYRSGDVTTALSKVLDSWKTSTSTTTKSRLTRIGSLLKEQFANKPPRLMPAKPATTNALAVTGRGTDVAVVTNRGTDVAVVTNRGTDVAVVTNRGTDVAVVTNRGTDVAVVTNRGTDVAVVTNRGTDVAVVTNRGTDVAVVTNRGTDVAVVANRGTDVAVVSNRGTDVAAVTNRGTDVATTSNRGLVLGSETSDISSDVVLAARRNGDVGPVNRASGPTNTRRTASNTDNAEDMFEFNGVHYTAADLKIAKRQAWIKARRAALSRNKGKIALAAIGGASLLCLQSEKCSDFISNLGSSPTSREVQDDYDFTVETKDVEGALHCNYKFTKKVAEGATSEETVLQEEMDASLLKHNFKVNWDPTGVFKTDPSRLEGKVCAHNTNPCIITKVFAQATDTELGYVAKLMLGEEEMQTNDSCKNAGKKTTPTDDVTTTTTEDDDQNDADGDGLPDYYDAEEEDEDNRGPAAFNPDPWNILGGNTGKKYPLTPPQPLIVPKNQQMYVTPGYY